jgi:hypothetical protein
MDDHKDVEELHAHEAEKVVRLLERSIRGPKKRRKTKFQIALDSDLLRDIDAARGDASRSKFFGELAKLLLTMKGEKRQGTGRTT